MPKKSTPSTTDKNARRHLRKAMLAAGMSPKAISQRIRQLRNAERRKHMSAEKRAQAHFTASFLQGGSPGLGKKK